MLHTIINFDTTSTKIFFCILWLRQVAVWSNVYKKLPEVPQEIIGLLNTDLKQPSPYFYLDFSEVHGFAD